MATIRDVARLSGVSISTVSTVLTNAQRPVSAHVRQKVVRSAKELDYHPNAMAQALVRRRMDSIGVLSGIFSATDIVTNSYAAGVMKGVLSEATEAKQNITLYTQYWRGAAESLSMFRDRRADGLILISPPTDSDIVEAVAGLGLPLVTVSTRAQAGVPSVDVDDVQGGNLVVGHLAQLGHKRIAHIGGNENLISTPNRRNGYLLAMQNLGLQVFDQYLQHAGYDGSEAAEAAIALFRSAEPPTAIFAGNDKIAIGVMEAAAQAGLRIPQDLSIVGYDDSPATIYLKPALTTVHQPLDAIGAKAARLLMASINGEVVEDKVYMMEPELVIRQTTAPIKM